MTKTRVTVKGICLENHSRIRAILAQVGCAGAGDYIDEVTFSVIFSSKYMEKDEIAGAIGCFVLAGFDVSAKVEEE